jgi:hypothetical protein
VRGDGVPPTTRYSALAADNSDNISTKCGFIAKATKAPSIPRELPHHQHTLARRPRYDLVVRELVA